MLVNFGTTAVVGFNSMLEGRVLRHASCEYLEQYSDSGEGQPFPIGKWMRFEDTYANSDPEICVQGWHFEHEYMDAYRNWHQPRNIMTMNLYGGFMDIPSPCSSTFSKTPSKISAEYRMCLGEINITNLLTNKYYDYNSASPRKLHRDFVFSIGEIQTLFLDHFHEITMVHTSAGTDVSSWLSRECHYYAAFGNDILTKFPNLLSAYITAVIIHSYENKQFPTSEAMLRASWDYVNTASNWHDSAMTSSESEYGNIRCMITIENLRALLDEMLPQLAANYNYGRISMYHPSEDTQTWLMGLPDYGKTMIYQFIEILVQIARAVPGYQQPVYEKDPLMFLLIIDAYLTGRYAEIGIDKFMSRYISSNIEGLMAAFEYIKSRGYYDFHLPKEDEDWLLNALPDLQNWDNVRSIQKQIFDNRYENSWQHAAQNGTIKNGFDDTLV